MFLQEHAVVILSTHIVADVSSLCSQMAVIRKEEILASTTPQQAIDRLKDSVWEATVPREQVGTLKYRYQVISSQMMGGQARLRVISKGVRPSEEFRIYCLAVAGACLSLAHILFRRKSSKGFRVESHFTGKVWSILLTLVSVTTAITTGWVISSMR